MVKKVLRMVIDTIFVVAIIGVLAILISNYFGFKMRVVKSGSMEPEIMTGSIAIVDENVPFDEIEVGDVIAFKIATGEMVTHRVVDTTKIDGQKYLMTKGDNVDIADGYTTNIQNYCGKTIFSVSQPKFNSQTYLTDVMNSIQGKIFVGIIGLALILGYVLLSDDEKLSDLEVWISEKHPEVYGEYKQYMLEKKDRKRFKKFRKEDKNIGQKEDFEAEGVNIEEIFSDNETEVIGTDEDNGEADGADETNGEDNAE